MKLFNRNPWITIWKEYGYAYMQQFGRPYNVESKSVVQVKEKKDGTYKARAFVVRAFDNSHIADITISYILHNAEKTGDKKLRSELEHYGII